MHCLSAVFSCSCNGCRRSAEPSAGPSHVPRRSYGLAKIMECRRFQLHFPQNIIPCITLCLFLSDWIHADKRLSCGITCFYQGKGRYIRGHTVHRTFRVRDEEYQINVRGLFVTPPISLTSHPYYSREIISAVLFLLVLYSSVELVNCGRRQATLEGREGPTTAKKLK